MSRLLKSVGTLLTFVRYARKPRTLRPYLRDLYLRRLAQGPEEYRPRFDWLNWNRDAEVSAFLHRVGESFSKEIMDKILMDRQESGNKNFKIQGNTELCALGYEVSEKFMTTFLHTVYPKFPTEWIQCIVSHLNSDEELAFIASHLGLKDLVLYTDQKDATTNKLISGPPSLRVLANSLMALIGALAQDQLTRAHYFIRDFILIRLVDLDLIELLTIPNPNLVLSGILVTEGRGPPEARLQWQSSSNTLLACYQVGIYSDRELLGEAPGETVLIAEEEATRQAIRNYFGLRENRPPIPFYDPLPNVDYNKPNENLCISFNTYMNPQSVNVI